MKKNRAAITQLLVYGMMESFYLKTLVRYWDYR